MERRFDRRSMIKAAGASGAALLAGPATGRPAAPGKKRHVIVGTGHRARSFQDAIWGKHKDGNSLVAICDTNPGRLSFTARRAAAAGAAAPKVYLASDFDRMIRETRPDSVIVTTPDSTHDDYIVRALDAGCEVITEKPMTTTAAKAQRILDAVKRNNRHVRVAFNYRFTPPRTQVKELLMAGRSATSCPSTSTGFSIPPTARIISAAGTAARLFPAASWSTSRPTISTSSTGGWAPSR